MDFTLFIFSSHNFFIWPAFIFTFLGLFYLYFKTKNDLKKIEKLFLLESNEQQHKTIQFSKKEKIKTEVLQTN